MNLCYFYPALTFFIYYIKMTNSNIDFTTLSTPKGYKAYGLHSGIKKNILPDLCLISSDVLAQSSGIFTQNRIAAAPVVLSRKNLQSTKSKKGVVITSGNANAATGDRGLDSAYNLIAGVSQKLACFPEEILIAQTGIIGIPFNDEIVLRSVPLIVEDLSTDGWEEAAKAMMTTDTFPKAASRRIKLDGKDITILGLAKGAAMIAPSMATMLSVILTDAAVEHEVLDKLLLFSAEQSFHCINIDGCTSTNDTVFLLANGVGGNTSITSIKSKEAEILQSALNEVTRDLAMLIARDAEGKNKFIHCIVTGAQSIHDARRAASRIVGSMLVKCAIAGELPYWGRVIAEVGASQIEINPESIDISFGKYMNCKNSTACDHDKENIKHYMKQSEIVITVDLKNGSCTGESFGSDLTHDYVTINMDKS
jgi:glutamate N-acetyltransferase / amino-acid N-acetyltransferase